MQRQQVLSRAGYNFVHPEHIKGMCCGVAFDGKGFPDQAKRMTEESLGTLPRASSNGEYPIFRETSLCVHK